MVRFGRRALWLAVVVGFGTSALYGATQLVPSAYVRTITPSFDFYAYQAAGRLAAQGRAQQAYDTAAIRAFHQEQTGRWDGIGPFRSGPILLPMGTVLELFQVPMLANHLMLLAALLSAAAFLVGAYQRFRVASAMVVPALMCFGAPAYVLLELGNWTALSLAAVAGAFWATRVRRPVTAGLLLALAIQLKLSPALLLLPLVATRRYRETLVTLSCTIAAYGVAALLFGTETMAAYVSNIFEMGGYFNGAFNNVSLPATVIRLSAGPDIMWSWQPAALSPAFQVGLRVGIGASFALLCLLMLLARRLEQSFDLLWSVALLWVPVFSPVTWDHYLVVLVLPMLVCAHRLVEARCPIRVVGGALLGCVCVCHLLYGSLYDRVATAAPWEAMAIVAFYPLVCVLLLALCVLLLLRSW